MPPKKNASTKTSEKAVTVSPPQRAAKGIAATLITENVTQEMTNKKSTRVTKKMPAATPVEEAVKPTKAAKPAKGKAPAAAASTGSKKAVKRDAAPAKPRGGKKSKMAAAEEQEEVEDEEEPGAQKSAARVMIDALKKADTKKKTRKVDSSCQLCHAGQILDDYDCMLNQTNIGQNNNKFYVIQVIQSGAKYYSWNRWGRVGEVGQSALKGPFGDSAKAIADFEKKFKDKTSNTWQSRNSFVAKSGKYTLIEMGDDEDEAAVVPVSKPAALSEDNEITRPCTLDKSTEALVALIFNNDMFNHALEKMEIDTKKMPLGKISKAQIAKGFEALEQIEAAIKNKLSAGRLAELSSVFYTAIPHNFGRQRPPTISDAESLQKKMDMLTVLSDIEVAQAMQKEKKAGPTQGLKPHPLDIKYELLKCDLTLLDKTASTFKILEKYLRGTECSYRKITILDIWEVNRHTEGQRFDAHKNLTNRKLLWHGTNVAVVAAILQSGLRIMPHSGGRVGKGIYFASENSKSAGYVRPAAGGIAIMFLNEVVLGEEHHISRDDSSLTAAPKGYHSIVAKGRTEPDSKLDATLNIDGHKVVVPQGKPVAQSAYADSSFSQSEYLVYREDQCRIRFILKLKFA